MNFNKATLVGRLTAKPELKSTTSGQNVTSFNLAVGRTWTDKDGKRQEMTDFFPCVFWGKLAIVIVQFTEKGQVLLVNGRLSTREWEDKNGSKHKVIEIVGEDFQFGPKPFGTTLKKAEEEGNIELPEESSGEIPF